MKSSKSITSFKFWTKLQP